MPTENDCVLIRCSASKGKLYVWLAHHWFSDVERNIKSGRTLIAHSTRETCLSLQELMTQQENQNAN